MRLNIEKALQCKSDADEAIVSAFKEALTVKGLNFKLVNTIIDGISAIHCEHGDCPEVAIALIAVGYNAKCMAQMDCEPVEFRSTDDNIEGAFLTSQAAVDEYNNTITAQFDLIDDLACNAEDVICEVISSWRD